jgi:hypothetical protein
LFYFLLSYNFALTNLIYNPLKIFKMKKVIFAVALMLGMSSVNAQSFDEGTKVIQAGIGLGSDFGTPIGASFEYGISEKIGVGAYFGYASKTFPVFLDEYTVTYMLFGAKGNYHFYQSDQIDAYGGLILGYNAATAKWKGSSTLPTPTVGGVTYGGVIGARYYFTESIGAFAEAGYGISYLTVGLAYKF